MTVNYHVMIKMHRAQRHTSLLHQNTEGYIQRFLDIRQLKHGKHGYFGRKSYRPWDAVRAAGPGRGELSAAAGYRHLDKNQWGLVELSVTEWHGMIFTGTTPAALSGLDEIVAPYEPERLVIAGRHTYEAASNWKILTENYHECYHCPSIHPELCRISPPKSGENYAADGAWIGGWMDLRDGMATMSLDGSSHGVPLRGLSGAQLRTVIYVNIFPNVLLSLHPDYVMTHRMVPLAADRTWIECTWAFAPEAVARPDFDPAYAVEFWDLTNRQDWIACESVQRGLSSRWATPGPLSSQEDAVYSFVTTVARGYLGQPVL
jgi:Rieske 2Fe-2S family protein